MNKDKRNNIQLLGTLTNADESGIIANANQIYDDFQQKAQETINSELIEAVGTGGSVDSRIASAVATETSRAQEAEANRYTKNETYTKEEVNNLITTPNQEYVSVTATNQTIVFTDLLPAPGAADTIYRVGNWDGSQYDVTKYSEYAWNGKDYVHLSTKTQIGDVFDISAYHATGGTLATYDDIEDALGANGENIPQSLKKGGMSVKFVQTSDNKYVQYRLMADSFTTDISYWEGMTIPPVSNNSIFNNIVKNLYIGGLSVSDINKIWIYKGFNNSGNYNYGFALRKTNDTLINLAVINDSSVLDSKYYYKKTGNIEIFAELVWDNASPRTEFENIVLSQDVNDMEAFPAAYLRLSVDDRLMSVDDRLMSVDDRLMSVDDRPIQGSNNFVTSDGINKATMYWNPTRSITPSSTYSITEALQAAEANNITINSGFRIGFTTSDYKYEEWRAKQNGSYNPNTWEKINNLSEDNIKEIVSELNILDIDSKTVHYAANATIDIRTDVDWPSGFIFGINIKNPQSLQLQLKAWVYGTTSTLVTLGSINTNTDYYFILPQRVQRLYVQGTNVTESDFVQEIKTGDSVDNNALIKKYGEEIEYDKKNYAVSPLVSDNNEFNKIVKSLYIPSSIVNATNIVKVWVYKGFNNSGNITYGLYLQDSNSTLHNLTKINDTTVLNSNLFHANSCYVEFDWDNIKEDRLVFEEISLSPIVNDSRYFPIAHNLIGNSSTEEEANVVVGNTIYAIAGERLIVYYKSVFNVKNIDNYIVQVISSKGKAYPHFFDYTPAASDIGTTTITFNLYKPSELDAYNGTLITSKVCNLVTISALKSSPASNKQILCIGDSLITEGSFVAEAYRRLTANDGSPVGKGLSNITFFGKKTTTKQGVTAHYEGTSGWSWNNYISPAEKTFKMYVSGVTNVNIDAVYSCPSGSITLKLMVQEINITGGSGYIRLGYHYSSPSFSANPDASGALTLSSGAGDQTINYSSYDIDNYSPFWNSTLNKIDITSYATQYGNGNLDILVCALGVNSIGQMWSGKTLNTVKGEVTTLLDAVHEEYPNAKVVLCLLPMPSQNGGFGYNYNASDARTQYNYERHAFELNQYYIDLANSQEYGSFVSIMNSCAEFDAMHLYPKTQINYNLRTNDKEVIGTNAVHPTTDGYLSIGDILYKCIYNLI